MQKRCAGMKNLLPCPRSGAHKLSEAECQSATTTRKEIPNALVHSWKQAWLPPPRRPRNALEQPIEPVALFALNLAARLVRDVFPVVGVAEQRLDGEVPRAGNRKRERECGFVLGARAWVDGR